MLAPTGNSDPPSPTPLSHIRPTSMAWVVHNAGIPVLKMILDAESEVNGSTVDYLLKTFHQSKVSGLI